MQKAIYFNGNASTHSWMYTRCVPMLRYDRTYKLMLKLKVFYY